MGNNNGILCPIKCVLKDYDYVGTEIVIPIGNSTSIRADVALYYRHTLEDGTYKYELLYIFEIHDTNPVNADKVQKILWLRRNVYNNLRVFEVTVNAINNIADVNIQHGGGAKSIIIEREIC